MFFKRETKPGRSGTSRATYFNMLDSQSDKNVNLPQGRQHCYTQEEVKIDEVWYSLSLYIDRQILMAEEYLDRLKTFDKELSVNHLLLRVVSEIPES